MRLKKLTLNINGVNRTFICNPSEDTLATVLRRLGLTGVKVGCGSGVCGACSVILNGKVIRSCTKKIRAIEEYSSVTTIEGIGAPTRLHPLQLAFMHCGAVQCGFCIPGFIVSAYALLQENPVPSRENVRDWFQIHKNVCRCTGYKQIVDAVMMAAGAMRGEYCIEDLLREDVSNGEYYGKSLVRPAALAKVCGVADYGDDVALKMPPGTLQVVPVQPRIAHHAKILSVDISQAERMPGVAKVITFKDVRGSNRLSMFQVTPRSTALEATHVLLAEDKIFNYGDIVALVAADTVAHARAAASKVKVEIQQLPEYLNYLDAVIPGAVRVHDDTPNMFAMQPVLKGDDVRPIFEKAPYVAEGSFYSSREPHMSIEGDTVQAYFDEDDILTVHCKTQALYLDMAEIAAATGLPVERVRVIENPTGGSFGWGIGGATYALAGLAAIATEMPVALSFTYQEFMAYSGKRSPSYHNARLACDELGNILAAEFDSGLDHGAYEELGDDVMMMIARFQFFPYNIPNVAGLVRVANTNHSFGTAYRGYGSPQAYTCSEALMDMLAEKAGKDPFEFRYKNIARSGDLNINQYPFRQYPMEKIMDVMRPIYEKAVAEAKNAVEVPGKRRGVGLAWGGFNVTSGTFDCCSVSIELNPDGSFTKYDTWQDQGQGGDVGSLLVTMEALKEFGVTPDRIHLIQNDSRYCPDSGASASSRSHFMNGKATIIAAEQLKNAMRKEDGSFRTYKEMISLGIPTKYEGTFENSWNSDLCDLDPNTGKGNPTPAYTYALFLAEVEVDVDTGKATVIGFHCVDDVGKVGNLAAVNGQAYGGMSHSIGFALSEQYEDVKKHNNILSAGIPYIKDIPDRFTVIHVEESCDCGPFGSSGASEAFQSGGHMAVINAINNACGVRVYALPASPEKIKEGLNALMENGRTETPSKYFLGSDLWEELERIKSFPLTAE